MVNRVLASVGPGETRVALLADDRLVGLLLDRDDAPSAVGEIHLGRIARVLPGLSAAFVDMGGDRHGFLPLRHRGAPSAPVPSPSEGDAVVVQVRHDAVEDKGPKLTDAPSLAGRFAVLTPGQPGLRMSRKIEDEGERARLEGVVAPLLAEDEGVILRTSAQGVGPSRLARDLAWLRETWREVSRVARAATAPARLQRAPDALIRALRDETGAGVREILVDDSTVLSRARTYAEAAAPELLDRLRLHGGAEDIFAATGVDSAIESALDPVVSLPSGGNLVIESTRALVAIDVNSGGHREGGRERTALNVNLEAVTATAAHLRLRNLSGLVLVDMLPMGDRRHGAQVLEAISSAVAADPVPVTVAGFTRMGLIELTRERRGASLAGLMLAPAAGTVFSPVTTAFAALRAVLREARRSPGARLTVRASPAAAKALDRGPARDARQRAETDLGRPFHVVVQDGVAADAFEVIAEPGSAP